MVVPIKKLSLLLLAALLLTSLFGCGVLELDIGGGASEAAATATPGRIPDNAVTLDLRGANVTAAELDALMLTRTLTALDIRDNDISVDAFNRLSGALPNCKILWSVPLGAGTVDSDSAALTLSDSAELAALQSALPYLPMLESVDMSALSVETEQLAALTEAYPNVRFSANLSVCGISVDTGATALDLSTTTGVSAYTTDELVSALKFFPAMERVNLTGQTLSFADMDKLATAYPNVNFAWSFSYLEVNCSSEDTFLDLSGKTIPSVEELAQTLRYLPALTALDLSDCSLSNEEMGALREQFPDVAIHWRITVGRWSMRTDCTAFSTGKEKSSSQVTYDKKNGSKVLKTEDIEPLRYCTEMVALDIGHQKIDDLSVVSNMKKLRFLIIADGDFTDITPIASCTELEFLEVFQNYIADFTPLLSLPKLSCLNCGATKSPDAASEESAAAARLAVLMQMPQLDRLWCIHGGFDKAQIAELQAALPDCKICSGGTHPTSNGYRAGNELYVEMQGLFELKVLN